MRTLALFLITILFSIFHAPGYAYYQWYDHEGFAHFTQNVPPANARNEDGFGWWKTAINQKEKEEKRQRKYRIQRARLKIKNYNAPEPPHPERKLLSIEEVSSRETGTEKPEGGGNKGLFKRLGRFLPKEARGESCQVPWLVEKHGICPLGQIEPSMDKVGNKFRAVVVDSRKSVWSDCRGTDNDDIITFIYKGQKFWETDGNVPECSFYRGFYWK